MQTYRIKFWDEDACTNECLLSADSILSLAQYLTDNKFHYQIIISIEQITYWKKAQQI